MTWQWLICFSLAAAGAFASQIEGRVTLQDSREASVRKDLDYSGVVLSLDPLDAIDPVKQVPKHATMVQKNKTFTPHILAVQAGTAVDFPNYDPIFHNAFSRYNGQIFDIGLYAPGKSRTIVFKRPGVVRVFCNIHPSMSAVIVVLNTPYFAKTGKDGKYNLEVPPGRYKLQVFHERATEQTQTQLARTITVGDDRLELPPIVISEAGYLPAPHNNKYDRPYSQENDDRSVYPGVRK